MTYLWPDEDGWPYPDPEREAVALDGDIDDDAVALSASSAHLLEHLEPLEREVIAARYGVNGTAVRSMKQLHNDLGIPNDQIRAALGDGLAKIRAQLS